MKTKVVSLSTRTFSSGSITNANLYATALASWFSARGKIARASRDTERRDRGGLTAEPIRSESGGDELGGARRCQFAGIEIALRPDRNQYRTRRQPANNLAQR